MVRSTWEYEHCIQEQEDGFRSEVTTVKGYIYHHYKEKDLGSRDTFRNGFLSPGYLSAVFKEETGDDTEPFYPWSANE